MQGVLDTTLCDKVGQGLVSGRWFSVGIPGIRFYHTLTRSIQGFYTGTIYIRLVEVLFHFLSL